MAIFSLSDISFGSSNSIVGGPLSALFQSPFQSTSLRYPADVGSYDKGHYMVFWINIQSKTTFDGIDKFDGTDILNQLANADVLSSIRGQLSAPGSKGGLLGEIAGAVNNAISGFSNVVKDVTKEINSAASGIKSGINELTSKLGLGNINVGSFDKTLLGMQFGSSAPVNTSPLRTTRRTSTCIALYMPDTLTFTYSHQFDIPSLTEAMGPLGAVGQAGKSTWDAIKNAPPGEGLKAAVENMKSFAGAAGAGIAGKAAGALGGNADTMRRVVMAAQGIATNPQLEVIYSQTNLRQFSFEFMFYPRSQAEAKQVMQIIEEFRFHSAPELDSSSGGRYLIPPSEFDIEFHMNGAPNPNIPKISTCVLTNIDLDFAPNGWSAYEVPGQVRGVTGGSGTPTAIRMTLLFQETQMITKEMIRSNYKTAGASRGVLEQFTTPDIRNGGGY